MEPPTPSSQQPSGPSHEQRKRPSSTVVNVLTALVGLAVLAAGVGWIVYSWVVNKEIPYFGIPLVLTVPVIAAVAFRNCWD